MKKYYILLMVLLLCVTLLMGCSQTKNENVAEPEASNSASNNNDYIENTDSTKTNMRIDSFANVKASDVKLVTKKGGLPSDKIWGALVPGKDSRTISKIIKLVNSNSGVRKSTKEDLKFLKRRTGYPIDIVIKLKDDSVFTLMSAVKLTANQTSTGIETTKDIYDDSFIFAHEKEGKTEYYTVFSKDAAEYISTTSVVDFPRVKISLTTSKN